MGKIRWRAYGGKLLCGTAGFLLVVLTVMGVLLLREVKRTGIPHVTGLLLGVLLTAALLGGMGVAAPWAAASSAGKRVHAAEEERAQRLCPSTEERSGGRQEGDDPIRELHRMVDGIRTGFGELEDMRQAAENLAHQADLLALNAAVEAARSGETDPGFSVVADETRSLAGESGRIAGQLRKLCRDTTGIVEESTQIVNALGVQEENDDREEASAV